MRPKSQNCRRSARRLRRLLREAFTRHHGLQCGFCTPGTLITARDLLTRYNSLMSSACAKNWRAIYVVMYRTPVSSTPYLMSLSNLTSWRSRMDCNQSGHAARLVLLRAREAKRVSKASRGTNGIIDSRWVVHRQRQVPIDVASGAAQEILSNLTAAATCVPGATGYARRR